MADSPKSDDGKLNRSDAASAAQVKEDNAAPASGEKTAAAQGADKADRANKTGNADEAETPDRQAAQAAVSRTDTPEAEIHKAPPKPRKAPPRKAGPVARSDGAKSPSSAKAARKTRSSTTPTPLPGKRTTPEAEARETPERRPEIKKLKEKIMATQNASDYNTSDYNMSDYAGTMTASMSDAVAQMQDRSKAAYEKGTEVMSEMSDFAKGNAEAMVESGRILSGGMQDMGKTYAEEARSAYELMTADLKEMAAVKSPAELFQLQGKIMRRNFDAMVAASSKNAEKVMKVSNDAFAPISARMNVAAEKISKVS